MRIGIYVRVSTTAQIVDGESLDAQKNSGIRFCKANGFEYSIFEDGGISGSDTEKREGYNEMIYQLRSGSIEGVWCVSTNRLHRENIAMGLFVRECRKMGWRLFVGGNEYDLDSPSDKLLLDTLAVFDSYFRDQNTANAVRGKQNLLSQNKWYGITPFGYDEVDRKLVVNEVEAEVINKMIDWVLEGESYSEISRLLKLEYGDSVPYRKGESYGWSEEWVYRTLRKKSHYALGELTIEVKGVANTFLLEPIVEYSKWEKAVAKMKNRQKHYRKQPKSYLENKVKCGHCGGSVTINKQRGRRDKEGKRKTYWYWRCLRKGHSECNKINLPINKLVSEVEHIFDSLGGDREKLHHTITNAVQHRFEGRFRKPKKKESRSKIVEAIEKEQSKIERAKSLFIEGEIDRAYLNEVKKSAESMMLELKTKLKPTEVTEVEFDAVVDLFSELLSIEHLDYEEFVERYVERIVLFVEKWEDAYNKSYSYKIVWKGLDDDDGKRYVGGEDIEVEERDRFSIFRRDENSYGENVRSYKEVKNLHNTLHTHFSLQNKGIEIVGVYVE